MKKKLALLIGLVLAFSASSSAYGDLVNVDFGTGDVYSGLGEAPGGGTVWQQFGAGAVGDAALVDSFGAESCVTMTKVATGGFTANGGGAPTTHDMMEDYLHDSNNGLFDNTVVFGGLIAGNTYTLYLYGHGDQANQDAQFDVFAANGGASGHASATFRDPITMEDTANSIAGNYVVLSAVADANGEVGYTWGRPAGQGGGHAAHNGVQIEGVFPVKVPEPGSALVLGLGGLFALSRRRR